MSKRTLGLLMTVGAAVGAWWWTSQRQMNAALAARRRRIHDHGTVIFDNTPTASDADVVF